VCDVYDSLSSDRPYRDAMPHAVCLEILREDALGGGLDPELVALFADILSSPRAQAVLSPGVCPLEPRFARDLLPQNGA
jgi:putative two-component system response regulator